MPNLHTKIQNTSKKGLLYWKTHRILQKLNGTLRKTKKLKWKSQNSSKKTQNSSKKLKDAANFGVIYCKNQQKGGFPLGETTKMAKSRITHYWMGTILKKKLWVFPQSWRGKTQHLKQKTQGFGKLTWFTCQK